MQNSAFTQGCQYFNCTENRDTVECKRFHVMLKYNNNEKEVAHFLPARSIRLLGYNIIPYVATALNRKPGSHLGFGLRGRQRTCFFTWIMTLFLFYLGKYK